MEDQNLDTKKIQIQTDSDPSSSQSEDSCHQPIKLKKNQITTVSDFSSYFNFFQEQLQSDCTQEDPHLSNQSIKPQINKILENHNHNQNEQQDSVKKISDEPLMSRKTLKFLKNYQQSHRVLLQIKLVRSGRFKKLRNFRKDIFIEKVDFSKYCEIVKLQVQYLWYRTQILILNSPKKSQLGHTVEASDSGSFGTIYLLRTSDNQELAIKCLSLPTQPTNENDTEGMIQNTQTVVDAVREYFFVLLFSQLKIGPQAKTIGGFDMVLNSDYIQFATEVCSSPKEENKQDMKKDLIQALFEMQMLQIVHRDIKPSNIMFSDTYKKHVFIDFGCSEGLMETVGQKTLTKFKGATIFASEEMLSLLGKKHGYSDLYFNDVFALQKSLTLKLKNCVVKINNVKSPIFYIQQMKLQLFKGDAQQFESIWRKAKKEFSREIDDIQIDILDFLQEVKIPSELRVFYRKEVEERVRQMDQFQELQKLMSDQSLFKISEIFSFAQKKAKLKIFQVLYWNLSLRFGDFSILEIQIQEILFRKQKIQVFIKDANLRFSKGYDINKDMNMLVKSIVIIASYATFAQNKYNCQIQKRIKACNFGVLILKQYLKEKGLNYEIYDKFFFDGIKQLQDISNFYKIYLFQVWKIVPKYFRNITAMNSILTLFLINPPIKMYPIISLVIESLKKSQDHKQNLKFQQKQIKQISQLDQEYPDWKKDDQIFLIKLQIMVFIWQLILMNIIMPVKKMPFRKSINFFEQKNFYSQYQKILQEVKKWIIKGKQNIKLFEIFIQLLNLMRDKDNQRIIDLNTNYSHRFNNQNKIQVQKHYRLIQKCQKLMQFIIIMLPKKNMQIKQNDKKQYSKAQQLILNQLSLIVCSKQLFFRLEIVRFFQISLKKNDWLSIKEIHKFLKRQFKYQTFVMSNSYQFHSIVKIIYQYFIEYINNYSKFSDITLQKTLCQLYDIVYFGWQIGQKSVFIKNQLKNILLNNRNSSNLQRLISQTILFSQMTKSYLKILQVLSFIYRQFLQKLQPYQRNFIQSQKFQNSVQKIQNNSKNYRNEFQEIVQLIQIYPQLKNSFQKDFTILETVLMHNNFDSNKSSGDNNLNKKIIEKVFENFQLQGYAHTPNTKYLPSINIALSYFSIKLHQSKYDKIQCQNMIKIFEISVKENFFPFNNMKNAQMVFRCFIYLQKQYEQIFRYFKNLTQILSKTHDNRILKQFCQQIKQFLSCRCQICLPIKPKKWKPQQFTQYLYNNIHLYDPEKNPYLAIVYFYSINYRNLSPELIRKFTVYILKSLPFLDYFIKRLIFNKIYMYVYIGFHANGKQQQFGQILYGKLKVIKKIDYSQRNLRIHRKFIYSLFLQKKKQSDSGSQLEDFLKRLFVKQIYFYDYKYPTFIKEAYKKKLKTLFETKQFIEPQFFKQKKLDYNVLGLGKHGILV